jgi:hypothetical protein
VKLYELKEVLELGRKIRKINGLFGYVVLVDHELYFVYEPTANKKDWIVYTVDWKEIFEDEWEEIN